VRVPPERRSPAPLTFCVASGFPTTPSVLTRLWNSYLPGGNVISQRQEAIHRLLGPALIISASRLSTFCRSWLASSVSFASFHSLSGSSPLSLNLGGTGST